jgi:NADPH-dependent 2,4-dienoyl-CoA reductase/sulfur reductase-like enzyme
MKVLIIGGGVGGMEAARVAAMRGHKVTLFEKSNVLGGQFLLACRVKHKREAKYVVDYLTDQMKKLNIDVRLGQEANLNTVRNIKPEVIIVATGATPIIPRVPGVNLGHVVSAHDVLSDKVAVKENVVVVGGGQVGIEAALYLKEKGKKVTIIEMLDELAQDAMPDARTALLEEISELGIPVLTNTKIKEIRENELVVEKLRRKQLVRIEEKIIKPVDTVVLAVGAKPEQSLMEILTSEGYAVHAVGDCVQPRRALHAIHEGFLTALRI